MTVATMPRVTDTDQVLALMWTENTGRHFLDSGGAYGRNWERNQGKDAEVFLSRPEAYVDRYCGVIVDAFHWVRERLEYDAELDARLQEFIAGRDDTSYLQDAEEFGIEVLGLHESDVRTMNTYNWDNTLNETLQWVEFGDTYASAYGEDGEDYGDVVLLQYHGGCDVRGGYTRPRAFRMTGDTFGYDSNDFSLSCDWEPPQDEQLPGLEGWTERHYLDYRGEWVTSGGSCTTTSDLWPDADYSSDFVTEDDEGEPVIWCPMCLERGERSRMTVHAPYAD